MNEHGRNKKKETIRRRQRKQQEMLLEQLQKTPIITIACNRAGIDKSTYYRWRENFPDFAGAVDAVIPEGIEQINDMAETVIVSAIKKENLRAAEFWLRNNKERYRNKPNHFIDSGLRNEVEKMRHKLKDFFNLAFKSRKNQK